MELTSASQAQRAELMDGEIIEAEYQAAFERFRSCLRQEGYELKDVEQDGPRILFGIPDEAVQSGVEQTCYDAEFRFVDVVWQLANSDPAQDVPWLNTCLEEHGLETGSTIEEIEALLAEAGLTRTDCATAGMDMG